MTAPLIKLISKIKHDHKGASLILIAASMVSLLGLTAMVVDIGQLVAAKYKLVNAVDAAAMAGANQLARLPATDPSRETSAILSAEECALKNGASSPTISVDGYKVTVNASASVDFYFAPVLGIHAGRVNARAAARAGGLRSYKGVTPLVIKEDSFVPGHEYTLKFGKPETPGNCGGLAITDADATGAKEYSYYLENGYQVLVAINDIQTTEPGVMAGPTVDAIANRLARCKDGCTWDHFLPGCPRIITIPTHNETSMSGRTDFTVKGFAPFFVLETQGTQIKGVYVNAPGEGEVDLTMPINGMYGVKLLE